MQKNVNNSFPNCDNFILSMDFGSTDITILTASPDAITFQEVVRSSYQG